MPRFLSGRSESEHPIVSPDGRLVACGSGKGIDLLPRDGWPPREIVSTEPLGNLIRWGADGRSVNSYRPATCRAPSSGPTSPRGASRFTGGCSPPTRRNLADPPHVGDPDGKGWAYSAPRWLGDLYVYSGLY